MARARFLIPFLFALGLGLQSAPASAQFLYHADRAAFATATGNGLSAVTFDELPDGGQVPALPYPGVTVSSPGFSPTPLTAVGPGTVSGLPSVAILANDASFGDPSPVVLDFAPGVQAVGLDVYSLLPGDFVSPPGTALTISVSGTNGSDLQIVPLTPGAPTFFGVIASVGTITNIAVLNMPGQARFVAADNVVYGNLPVVDPEDPEEPEEPPVVDPLDEVLDELGASIAEGRADGSIKKLGSSLEDKLALARLALEDEDEEAAADALKSLGKQVLAHCGRHISRSRAGELIALVKEALELLDPENPKCQRRHRHCHHRHCHDGRRGRGRGRH